MVRQGCPILVVLVLGCSNVSGKGDTGSSSDAWPEWKDEEDSVAESVVLPTEDENDDIGICEPEVCIELAEATDRGFASVEYGFVNLTIENHGPYPICFESWYTFFSRSSQDAVAGTTGSGEIEPGESVGLPYGEWGTDQTSWWCIEHNQSTSAEAAYDFNGARAPSLTGPWAQSASDEDGDGAEDHTDAHPDDALPQTQHNTWDYIAGSPVFVVGREMNWFEVRKGQTVTVTLQVTNIGRVAGEARVTERVPPGWVVSATAVPPDSMSTAADGIQSLSWLVSLDGAEEPANTSQDTDYDEVELDYELTYAGLCGGRELGYEPTVLWADPLGGTYLSDGSPLVIQCCDNEDGPGLGTDIPP